MTRWQFSRRALLLSGSGGAVAGTVFGPWRHNHAWAAASDKPLKIGITSDASGQYANSGASDRRGMMMAIEEANDRGGVLGRKIEWTHIDTETNPATASRVAERLITREQCHFLIGAVHSGCANAISQVAQKYGVVYLNTNSSSPSESGKDCHRVKFVWDGNGTNFAKASVKKAIETYGKTWLLMTNDYTWGHTTAAATKKLLGQLGGEVSDELLVPVGTRDFTSYLLTVQQQQPAVIATAIGGDDIKALRQQVGQLGMGTKPAWLNNQQDWPDVYGLPLDNLFGVFGTTWYWKLDLPGVAEFVQRYQAAYPDTGMRVPGNVFYNGYMATFELLEAVERAGSTNNIAVIKALEGHKMTAGERLQHHDAVIDAATHQVQQTIYLATAQDKAVWEQNSDDMYKIIAVASPDEARDVDAAAACKLESYDATPTFDA